MPQEIDLSNPEWLRLQDVANEAQTAMFHHLEQTGGLRDTIAIVITASRTHPGVTTIQGHGIDEDDAITFLQSIIDTTDAGNYRTVDVLP